MFILALDATLGRCSASLTRDGVLLSVAVEDRARGHAALLAPMAAAVLDEARLAPALLDAIAVTVGPGSFTGLRAALSLGHGLAFALEIPLVGVTVGEAMAAAFPALGRRALWTAIDSRRGRVFLDRGPLDGDDRIAAFDLQALPVPDGPIAVAGDAAIAVAAALAATGANVVLTDLRKVEPRHVARAALRRLSGELPPRVAQPLYVDPPEAKRPAGGLRPAPVPPP